ncbi:MAG: polysaccharide biosynthesis/export family protein [Pseudomonadota bacterium]
MVCALTLSSCGLIPRSGPSKNEIFAGSVQREGDAFIITVNDRINRAAAVTPAFGFSEAFLSASTIGSDIIRPGDTLSLTIWENVDNPLLGGTGQGAATLGEVQVDGAGFIFVPYAGRIRASGSAPESIRQTITQRLSEQTPDPQVEVRRLAGDGSTVSIVGDAVGGQGIFPIERPTRTLSAMLAQAGGITTGPDVAQVTVIRGDQSGTIWFQDLFDDPRLDISLRGGDRIIVQEDSRSFTALGATGSQSRVTFDSQTISAIEAIATVGGLSSNVADPQGVFVLRNEPAEIARAVTGRGGLQGDQRVAYVLDLTQPNGMFMARDFAIRDGDTVYVTEAPIVTWNKTISAITGSLGNVNSLANTVSGG